MANPFLKQQALPGSYADFLTNYEQYKPVGPKPWHTGATSFDAIIANNDKISNSPASYDDGKYNNDVVMHKDSGSGTGDKSQYERWLEQYGQLAQLIPAQSYGDWLMAGGMAGAAQKAYNDAVRAAETDYEKSKAMYGANAEALGRAGLTGSGYGDYLTGAGFSGMQGAKVAAADTKALTEAKQRSDYASYLMGVQQTNAQLQAQADAANRQSYAQYLTLGGEARGVIDSMMQSGQDDAAIKAYIQQHYGNQFDSQLDGWIAGAHTYNDAIIAETNAAKTEAETEDANALALERAQKASKDLTALYANGVTGEAARLQLINSGYTESEAGKAITDYQNVQFAQIKSNLELKGITLDQIPTADAIANSVAMGQISETQAQQLRSLAQTKREGLLDKEYDNLTNEDAPDFINQVHSLYKSGDLPREKYAEYVGNLVAENVASIADDKSAKEPAVEVAAIINDIKNSDAYNDIEDALLKKIADAVDVGVRTTGGKIILDVGGKKEKIELIYGSVSEKERQNVDSRLGVGELGSIKEIDGTLWQWNGYFWTKVTGVSPRDVGTTEYASMIYDLLLAKYKK